MLKKTTRTVPFVRVDDIVAAGRKLTAKIAIHQLMSKGAIKEKSITVRPGDLLEKKANRSEYEGYEVEEINFGGGFVRFVNGVEVRKGGLGSG